MEFIKESFTTEVKGKKKDAFVYERGTEIITELGEMDYEKLKTEGWILNEKKTNEMRELLKITVKEVKSILLPYGIRDREDLDYVNGKIKDFFEEAVKVMNPNRPFYGPYSEKVQGWVKVRQLAYEERGMVDFADEYSRLVEEHERAS